MRIHEQGTDYFEVYTGVPSTHLHSVPRCTPHQRGENTRLRAGLAGMLLVFLASILNPPSRATHMAAPQNRSRRQCNLSTEDAVFWQCNQCVYQELLL